MNCWLFCFVSYLVCRNFQDASSDLIWLNFEWIKNFLEIFLLYICFNWMYWSCPKFIDAKKSITNKNFEPLDGRLAASLHPFFQVSFMACVREMMNFAWFSGFIASVATWIHCVLSRVVCLFLETMHISRVERTRATACLENYRWPYVCKLGFERGGINLTFLTRGGGYSWPGIFLGQDTHFCVILHFV